MSSFIIYFHSRNLFRQKVKFLDDLRKVLLVKIVLELKFTKFKSAKFRDFPSSRNFLPAKLSTLKVSLSSLKHLWFRFRTFWSVVF